MTVLSDAELRSKILSCLVVSTDMNRGVASRIDVDMAMARKLEALIAAANAPAVAR